MQHLIFFLLILSTSALAAPGKIAMVQYLEKFGEVAHNLQQLTAYAEEAASHGANLVLFPEGTVFGYDSGKEVWCSPGKTEFRNEDGEIRKCRDVSKVAEPVPSGKTTRYWQKFAKEKNIYVLFNIIEVSGKKYYNTLVAANPQGGAISYRKRSLFETEFPYGTPGKDPVLLDTPFGKFGLLVCIDGFETNENSDDGENLYKGYYDGYKKMGANAILIPMSWDNYDPRDEYSAERIFTDRARRFGIEIFASDAYNGTARYFASNRPRDRGGLKKVREQGISYHEVDF